MVFHLFFSTAKFATQGFRNFDVREKRPKKSRSALDKLGSH